MDMTTIWVTADEDQHDVYEVVVTVTLKASSLTEAIVAVAEVVGQALQDNT